MEIPISTVANKLQLHDRHFNRGVSRGATGFVLSTYSNGMFSFFVYVFCCCCCFIFVFVFWRGWWGGGGCDLPTANETGRVLSGTGVSSHSTEEKVVV